MRSLVFANHGVGDAIMAFPLIRALSSEPDDLVLVLTKSSYVSQVVSLGAFGTGRVTCCEIRNRDKSMHLGLYRKLRNHKSEAAVLTYGVAPLKGALTSIIAGASIRIGPKHPIWGWLFTHKMPYSNSVSPGFHKVEYALRALEKIGRKNLHPFKLAVNNKWLDLSDKLLPDSRNQYIGIAFGSGVRESHKRVPVYFAKMLIKSIKRRFHSVVPVLLGSSSEKVFNSAISDGDSEVVDLTGRTSAMDLFSVLKRCEVLYATCNGISHFAAAVGCPVVGFFGPTNPNLTGPYGVPIAIISKKLECSPCYKRGYIEGCGRPKCMEFEGRHIEKAMEAGMEFIIGKN